MLSTIINILWAIVSIILIIILALTVILFAVLVTYFQVKEQQKPKKCEVKLVFDGPSRTEMQATTHRLLKQERRYRRPYYAR